jgi:UMP-CMP kinase
VVSN